MVASSAFPWRSALVVRAWVLALLVFLPYAGRLTWRKMLRIGYLPQGLNQMSVREMPLTVGDFFRLNSARHVDALNCLSRVVCRLMYWISGPAIFRAENFKEC